MVVLIPISPRFFWYLAGIVAHAYYWMFPWGLEYWGRENPQYSGDDIPMRENAIVIANHRHYLDWLMIFALAERKGRVGACKLFAKEVIKYIPGFGWGLYLSGTVFLSREWTKDITSINKTFENIRTYNPPVWMISHVEGTRLSAEKKAQSQKFAREKGLPVLERVLLPRTKGFIATVQALRENSVNAVYDFTIAYKNKKTNQFDGTRGFSFWECCFRTSKIKPYVHVRRYPIESLPTDEKGLTEWLYARWQEKDELLAYLEKNKEFPNPIPITPWHYESLHGPGEEINDRSNKKRETQTTQKTATSTTETNKQSQKQESALKNSNKNGNNQKSKKQQ